MSFKGVFIFVQSDGVDNPHKHTTTCNLHSIVRSLLQKYKVLRTIVSCGQRIEKKIDLTSTHTQTHTHTQQTQNSQIFILKIQSSKNWCQLWSTS